MSERNCHRDNSALRRLVVFCCFLLTALYFFPACTPKKPPEPLLTLLEPSQYPSFSDDIDYIGLEHSIRQSLKYLSRIPSDRQFSFGKDTYDALQLIRTLEDFSSFIRNNPSKEDLEKHIRAFYRVYQFLRDEEPEPVLFTGYYEPLLKGSLQPYGPYQYPVYALPDDLVTIDLSLFSEKFKNEKIVGRYTGKTVVPYYDRKEIEQDRVLEGKAKALAWVDDRVALFFLQIQGSGKIALDNGQVINVHYHGKNGRPYISIGRYMLDNGILTSGASMQKIREYLTTHPDEADKIMFRNRSYVFFTIENDGPLGAINVTLTPGRSIAVDKLYYPMAALSFVQAKKPLVDGDGRITEWLDCGRFVLNQDVGGAIKGPGRADFFWGNGAYAEIAAGHMYQKGAVYVLVLK